MMKQTKTERGWVKTCFHCNLINTSRRIDTSSAISNKLFNMAKTKGELHVGPESRQSDRQEDHLDITPRVYDACRLGISILRKGR